MSESQRIDIEAYLLSGYLGLQQIAKKVGVSIKQVEYVMMHMEIPVDSDE